MEALHPTCTPWAPHDDRWDCRVGVPKCSRNWAPTTQIYAEMVTCLPRACGLVSTMKPYRLLCKGLAMDEGLVRDLQNIVLH